MTTPHQPTISSAWDQASDGTFVATVRVSDLASEEQAKADMARMRNALSTQQPELPALSDILTRIREALDPQGWRGRFKPTPGEWVADAHEGWAHPMTEVRTEESREDGGHSIVRVRADFNCTVGKAEYEWANAAFVAACSPQNMRVVLAHIEQLEAAVLADRERREVVAWRYLPSPTWGEYVITQDPKVAESARRSGLEVEEMTVDRRSKVEDKTS